MSSGRGLQIPLHQLEREIVFSLNTRRRECNYLSNMGVCTQRAFAERVRPLWVRSQNEILTTLVSFVTRNPV